MTVKVAESLVLTHEEYDILVKANKLIDHIYSDTADHGTLEAITSPLVDFLDDLLNYEHLKVE